MSFETAALRDETVRSLRAERLAPPDAVRDAVRGQCGPAGTGGAKYPLMVRDSEEDATQGPARPVPFLRLTLTAMAVLLALFGVATLFGFFLETSTTAMRVPEDEPVRREALRLLLGVAAIAVAAVLGFFTLLGIGRGRPEPPPS